MVAGLNGLRKSPQDGLPLAVDVLGKSTGFPFGRLNVLISIRINSIVLFLKSNHRGMCVPPRGRTQRERR